MKLKWKFLDNQANENEGLANSGIETFRDSPFSSIARECGQNSIDASIDKSLPIELKFEKIVVPINEIPDVKGLRETVENCLAKSEISNSKKEMVFFKKAREILQNERVSVLRILDSDTSGVTGPCEPGTPYYALVRSTGVSEKQNDTAGGSFGIGKNAAFAMSALRTVFYSTNYIDNHGDLKFLCQGKSLLISHENREGEKFRGTGYCGINDYDPIESQGDIPNWLKVEKRGAAIVIIGFDDENNWEERVSESLLRNFFASVYSGSVIFNVNDKYQIRKDNLYALFKNKDIIDSVENLGSDKLSFSYSLFRCISSDLSFNEVNHIPKLGRFKLSILVEDGLEKQVGFIRNGMYITNELTNFKDKMKRFYSFKDFVAVIEPVDDESISIMRAIENPKHDEFSPSRIDEDIVRSQIISGFNILTAWAKSEIKKLTTPPPKDEILLDELNDFFSAPNGDDIIEEDKGEDNPESVKIKKHNLKITPISNQKTNVSDDSDSDSGKHRNSESNRQSNKKIQEIRTNEAKQENSDNKSISYSDLRTIRGDDSYKRIIYLTPDATTQAVVNVYTPGLSKQEEISIAGVDDGHLKNGKYVVEFIKGSRTKLMIYFKQPYDGPIIVSFSKGDAL